MIAILFLNIGWRLPLIILKVSCKDAKADGLLLPLKYLGNHPAILQLVYVKFLTLNAERAQKRI